MESKPYDWPQGTGLLTARLLRDYAAWLFPRLDIEWESPGVIRRVRRRGRRKDAKPYQFRKSKGLLSVGRDIRPFSRYVLEKLQPWAARMPFLPKRKQGLALMSDLRAFAAHVELILKKKKEEQSKAKTS